MQTLSSEQVEAVSGGFGAYDVGRNIGASLRSALLVFAEMGSLYEATY